MSGTDELQKYLQAIYDQSSKKATTEHQSVRVLQSLNDSSQTDITYNIDTVANNFGVYAGYIGYADTFDRIELYPTGIIGLADKYVPDMPLLARPVQAGAQKNVIVNGSFESGYVSGSTLVLDAWNITTTGTITHSESFNYSSKSDQTRSVEVSWNVTSGSGNVTISQDITNLGKWGKVLKLDWDRYFVSRTDGFADAQYRYDFYDGSGASISSGQSGAFIDPTSHIPGLGQTGALDSGWTKFTDIIRVPAGTYKITISFGFVATASEACVCRLDNVSLRELDAFSSALFFSSNTPNKEGFAIGATRVYDMFARTPTTSDIGVSDDHRIWQTNTPADWTIQQVWGGVLLANIAFVSSSGPEWSVVETGISNDISITTEFLGQTLLGGSVIGAGIICRYSSSSSYLAVYWDNTNFNIVSNGTVVASTAVTGAISKSKYIINVTLVDDVVTGYLMTSGAIYTVSYSGDTHTGTRHGLYNNNSISEFTRFSVSDVFWKGSSNIKVSQTQVAATYLYCSDTGTNVSYMDLGGPASRVKYKANIYALPTGSDHAGIAFRVHDANNYWKFYADTAGFHILPVVGGIAGTDIVTDTRKPYETNISLYSDENGICASVGDLYYEEVLADSPLAYFRLDDTSGTVATNSSNNNNAKAGTYTVGVSLSQTGALSTDPDGAVKTTSNTFGNGATADVEYLPTSVASRTLECWVKPTSAGALTQGGICGYPYNTASSGNNWFALDYNLITSNKRFVMDFGGATVNSASTYAENNWYHVVMTYDGTTARLYVNGVQDTSSVITLATVGNGNGTTNFNILGANVSGNQQRDCFIDEVAIYDTCLSAGRIAAHYYAGVTGSILQLNSNYRFDSTLLSSNTGFGIYFKGTSGKITNTFVQHLDFIANYKDFAFFDRTTRIS